MKLRELQEMIEIDSDLRIDVLDAQSIETAKLQSKYFVLYSNIMGEKKNLEYELSDLLMFKYKYYKGQCDPEVYKQKPFHEKLTNSGVEAHVNADEEVLKIKKKIDLCDIKLVLVDDMKKSLASRNWNIRNAIDFLRFKNGM